MSGSAGRCVNQGDLHARDPSMQTTSDPTGPSLASLGESAGQRAPETRSSEHFLFFAPQIHGTQG